MANLLPNDFLLQCKFPLMLSSFQILPSPIDVRNQFALPGQIWSLIVRSHSTLDGKQ